MARSKIEVHFVVLKDGTVVENGEFATYELARDRASALAADGSQFKDSITIEERKTVFTAKHAIQIDVFKRQPRKTNKAPAKEKK